MPDPFFKYQSGRFHTRAQLWRNQSSTRAGGLGLKRVCGPQFLHRGSDDSSSAGSSRRADQDAGEMAELSIPGIHQDTQGDSLCSGMGASASKVNANSERWEEA